MEINLNRFDSKVRRLLLSVLSAYLTFIFTYLIFAYSESKLRSYFVPVVVSNGKVYFIKMMLKNPSIFF